MARLIDADALCKRIRERYDGYMLDEGGCRPLDFEDMVEEQPTAYDVDKVVEELEKYRDDTTQSVTGIAAAWAYRGAIDIVRKGGVE